MQWQKARELFPNKWLLLRNTKERIEGNTKYIEDVEIIDIIEGDDEATRILVRCRGDKFVYHTSKEEISMEIVNPPILRGIRR